MRQWLNAQRSQNKGRKRALLIVVAVGVGSAGTAWAHSPISTNPFIQEGCSAGLPDLVEAYAVLGAFQRADQTDYVCLDAPAGFALSAVPVIPFKAVYDAPNDVSLALVGPGLPVPTRPVPGAPLDTGWGVVYGSTATDAGSFPQRTSFGAWHGQELKVTLPQAVRYEVRVYSPGAWRGEYMLIAGPLDALLDEDTKLPLPGDMDADGAVTGIDAIKALSVALDIEPIENTLSLNAGDVAPPGQPSKGYVHGDGIIDVADATRIFRKAMGLETGSRWPD